MNIESAIVFFQVPADLDPEELPMVRVELASWHLSMLPAMIFDMDAVGLNARKMGSLRDLLARGHHAEAARKFMPDPPERVRWIWAEAMDMHYGRVFLLFAFPPNAAEDQVRAVVEAQDAKVRPTSGP
jgi:hypothetical protein